MTNFLSQIRDLLNPLKRRAVDLNDENVASPKSRRFDEIANRNPRNFGADELYRTLSRKKRNDELSSLLKKEVKSSFISPFADFEFSDEEDIIQEKFAGSSYLNPPKTFQERTRALFDGFPSAISGSKSKIRNIPIEIERKKQPPPPLNSIRKTGVPPLQRIRLSNGNGTTYSRNVPIEKMNGYGNGYDIENKLYNTKSKEDIIRNAEIRSNASKLCNGIPVRSTLLQTNSREEYQNLLSQVRKSYQTNYSAAFGGTSGFVADSLKRRSINRRSQGGKILDIINLVEEEDTVPKETIDLSSDDVEIISVGQKSKSDSKKQNSSLSSTRSFSIEPVNSLKLKLEHYASASDSWLHAFTEKYTRKHEEKVKEIFEQAEDVRRKTQETRVQEKILQDKFRDIKITHETIVLDEPEPEEEIEEEFPDFTPEQRSIINHAINGRSHDEVLINKFNLSITRRDILTLTGTNWLNDEVINFYMNLISERSQLLADRGLPSVYAMNTFFLPRLMSSGYSGVRRWTRRIDIFAHDIIPVPVHVGGIHWCMAIIHLKKKYIHYYDSMGDRDSNGFIMHLENYIREESLDKRKQPFDTSDFVKASITDCPRQHNGSDCGVFSCMFAEYITRGRDLTFSQENMQYFRQKMILEIVQGQLLLPKSE